MNNKKIIWISSYPKSGNTWMRYLLANYFYNLSKKFDPQIIKNIEKFQIDYNLKKNLSPKEDLGKYPYNISKYWIKSQEKIKIENGNTVFFKNHNALVSINNNEFTNESLSLAAIYIVRDPRDVVVSYAKYRNLSYDQTIENLISKNLFYVRSKDDPYNIEILGSWKFHYNSWKNGLPSLPRIIVKYEDLLNDCYFYFLNVISFLSKVLNFSINKEQISNSVEYSSFEKLKNYERNNNYFENTGNNKFFRKGVSRDWVNELTKEQIKKIENEFSNEMDFLGYN